MSRGRANTLAILKNTNVSGHALSNTSFIAGARLSTGASSEPQGFAIGDIDGDTKPDMAVANYGTNTISLFENFSVPLSSPVAGVDTLCINSTELLHSAHCNTAAGYWRVTNNHATVIGGIWCCGIPGL